MIEVIRLKAEHFEQLLAQEWNAEMRPYFTPEAIKRLENNVHSYSAITASGRVVFCGGVTLYWPNRCEVWAVFDPKCKREFMAIHREVKKFLYSLNMRRIEASVRVGFESGERWVKALGFKMEAPIMKAYTPGGEDCSLYALVKEVA
jgi:hypothetical protein